MKNSTLMSGFLGLILGVATTFSALGENPLQSSIDLIERWVEVEKTISRERADWEIRKQNLEDVIAVYERELQMLNERISDAQDLTSSADTKRAGLLDEQEQFRRAEERIERSVLAQEALMLRILARLPKPLMLEVMPLSQRVPHPGKSTVLSLSQRLQSIVGILTQVDKFNTSVEVIPEQRTFEDGSVVEVSTLYFGLGAAYYSDKAGAHAGIGYASSEGGWVWEARDELGPRILSMIRMYQGGTNQIRFVPVPVEIR